MWDDYRFFLCVARCGSIRTAAGELRVNPSTVTRRLDAFEQNLGVLLFTRSPNGLQITPEGAQVLQQVEEVGRQLAQVESTLKGKNQHMAGLIRVALHDLAAPLILSNASGFSDLYPQLEFNVLGAGADFRLADGQLDVALQVTEFPPENMVGRPLGQIALAIYCSRDFLTAHDVSNDVKDVDWVAGGSNQELAEFDDQHRFTHVPNSRVRFRCDQLVLQRLAVRGHLGLGILPCYVAEQDEALIRVPGLPVFLSPTLWLLTHPDLRHARRIQAFMAFVRELFQQQRQFLTEDYL
jgi:DNA-binding transcriptional LysR family regulator